MVRSLTKGLKNLVCKLHLISGARRDQDGYLWITGRVDDMLNVSGHLMSTAEVESVLTEHPRVSEAAVVSRPHPVKGECLYCFITPNQNETFDKKMTDELKALVRERIGELDCMNFEVCIHGLSHFRTICSAGRDSKCSWPAQDSLRQNHATSVEKGCDQ